MAQQRREKVSTEGTATPLQNSALSALDALINIETLPPGRDPVSAPIIVAEQEKPNKGRLVLRREKKDRGGKTVVVISGFRELKHWNSAKTEQLAKDLRRHLGCGGAIEQGEVILQGDQPARVAQQLTSLGFRAEGVVH